MDYRDTSLSPEERAKALLAQMSPEEKLGQLQGHDTAQQIADVLAHEHHAVAVGPIELFPHIGHDPAVAQSEFAKSVAEERE